MYRSITFVVLATGAAFAAPTSAAALDRYVERPPAVLSPDRAEPWINQLRARPVSYRDVTGPVVYAPGRSDVAPRSRFAPDQPVRSAAVEPRRPADEVDPRFLPSVVDYATKETPGTVVVDTTTRHLYLVMTGGKARRYGVGVGRPGFQWAGVHQVTRKAEWPDWTPPPAMLKRKPDLPRHMDGGPDNPLGARALYLGSTEYRIHGSNEPWTIGQAVSSGCIRMRNEDVTDLYGRVPVGTKVIVM
ncbi:MAG: L,D-transpeptidase [Hyphomicrobiales bacterium]|nr:L,D-transpeptidase [Hyphomicrobiales bacterium]